VIQQGEGTDSGAISMPAFHLEPGTGIQENRCRSAALGRADSHVQREETARPRSRNSPPGRQAPKQVPPEVR